MKRVLICGVVAVVAFAQVVGAAEAGKPYLLVNRLRLEYDDNIYQEDQDKNDSLKLIEELELTLGYHGEQTYLGLRYRPSFVWWDKREPDDTDFQNELDVVVNHTFTPRLALGIVDTFRRGQLPELMDRDVIVREKDDFIYNSANGTLAYRLRPETRLDLAGRYVLLRYDRKKVADTEDYDLWVAGLTLRHNLVPETAVMADVRLEDIKYEGPERGSQTLSAGLGAEQMFNPNLVGSVRAGYQEKQYDADALGTDSAPYGEVALTISASPATRLSLGASYSFVETDVYPYANQTRSRVYASLAHDLTARVALYLSGGYTVGEYDASDSIEPGVVSDGDETVTLVSARATYRVNRSNWLEAGWQYQDFDSELKDSFGNKLRESYERNRISVGWKTQF